VKIVNKWEDHFLSGKRRRGRILCLGKVCEKESWFLQYSFQMHDLEEITNVVYCCFILRSSIAVEEKVKSYHDTLESVGISYCVKSTLEVQL
jgi:hypothetical protein